MTRTVKMCAMVGLLAIGTLSMGGCGLFPTGPSGSSDSSTPAPVVVGQFLSLSQMPTSTASWKEVKTDNTSDWKIFYLNGSSIVAVKTNTTVGDSSTGSDNVTRSILSNTIVAGQQVTISKITGTLSDGTSVTGYLNGQIDSGAVTGDSTNVTATYTTIYSTGEDAVSTTRTLTGTVSADGKTFNFTHVKVVSTPAQSNDGDTDTAITWTLQ